MQEHDFGIYILTYPKDFHLCKVLINSLNYFHPNIPVMILPGSGFDVNNHPFNDIPIMEPPNSYLRNIGDYDRKFWMFQGPFKKFLYIDADIICVKSIENLINLILKENDSFFYVNVPQSFIEVKDSQNPKVLKSIQNYIMSGQLGNLENIKKFDPTYDFFSIPLFNSGLFASSKESIKLLEIIDFFQQEKEFYEKVLNEKYSGKNFTLFFGDQGKLNYLVWKNKIPLKSLYNIGHFRWGGEQFSLTDKDMLKGENNYHFIHWAGCPRPSNSIFNKGVLFEIYAKTFVGLEYNARTQNEIPGLQVWEYFNDDKTTKSKIKYSFYDITRIFKFFITTPIKRQLKKIYRMVNK